MTDAAAFATLDGRRLTSCTVTVASVGPWYADCALEDDAAIGERVTLVVGGRTLLGAVQPNRSGVFGLQRKCRVVGGAGGWSSDLEPKPYQNDAGVKAKAVADDAAREVGETLDRFEPSAERVGRQYIRERGVASHVLESVIGDALWWVDYEGKTQVGTRDVVDSDPKAYELISYDPLNRIATLALDDPHAVGVGSTVRSDRLDGSSHVVRDLDLQVGVDGVRVVACFADGGQVSARGRLAELVSAIAKRSTDARLLGLFRYRCMATAAEGRLELQAVRRAAGLPDALPISQWPGVPGVAAELAPGAECLVQFIEGDRAQPVVTHYAGPDGVGFVPTSLVIGGDSGMPAARQGDAVEVLLPPAFFTGTITINGQPSPATGVVTFPPIAKALGVITAGSGKVKVAT